jgi:hypothetical protein
VNRGRRLAQCALLALPGAVGLVGLVVVLDAQDMARIAFLTMLGPYLLGASKLYEGYAIRKTQRALLELVPAALRAADYLIPSTLADGLSDEDLREGVRAELRRVMSADWGQAEDDGLIEEAIGEMAKRFDPFKLVQHARTGTHP